MRCLPPFALATTLAIALGSSLVGGCSSAPGNFDAGVPYDFAAAHGSDLGASARDFALAPPNSDLALLPPNSDLAQVAFPPDLANGGGGVGVHGGSVERLFFAFHGDTRPDNPDDSANYPSAIIRSIYQREAKAGVQFAVDLGDHLNATTAKEAQTQMGLYMEAAQLLGKPTFMTMGNHECSVKGICDANDPGQAAFLAALKPISPIPYYSIDVKTAAGLATLVVVADNAWDNAEAQWLDATLGKADVAAKYTIVLRHHPLSYVKLSVADETRIIQAHKYTLLLVSHNHLYQRDSSDPSGRTIICGLGGASLAGGATYYGYGTVSQEQDNRLTVSIYDESTDMIQDSFAVTPQ